MRPRRSLRRSESGAAMVEMAFVLPVFLTIVWGVIDLGRLLFAYNSMQTAVREGARQAAVLADLSNTSAVVATVKAAYVPMGSDSVTSGEITIDTVTTPGSVIVKISNHPWSALTPLSSILGQTVSMTRQATFRRER